MDPEQTFLRVHARLSGMLAQLLTPRIRRWLEYFSLGIAIILLGLLVVMHVNFVAQPGCADELSGSSIAESQLVQIKITSSGLWSQKISELSQTREDKQGGSIESLKMPEVDGEGFSVLAAKFWLNWLGSGARKNNLLGKSFKSDKNSLDSQIEQITEGAMHSPIGKSADVTANAEVERRDFTYGRDLIKSVVSRILNKWNLYISAFFKGTKQFSLNVAQLWKVAGWELFLDSPRSLSTFPWKRLDSVIVDWIERRSKASEPTYLYTVEKGE